MNRSIKIIFFISVFIIMFATTVWASLQQNLFTEFNWSGSPMWFKATIIDFYLNQIILWLWVVCLEKNHLVKFLWLIIFICLGSMGTALYALYRLITNKPLLKKEYV